MSGIWATVLRRRLLRSRIRVAVLFALTAAVAVGTIEVFHTVDHLRNARETITHLLREETLTLLVAIERDEHLLEEGDTLAFLNRLRELPLQPGTLWAILLPDGTPWLTSHPFRWPGTDTLSLRTRWREARLGTLEVLVAYPLPLHTRAILLRFVLELVLFLPIAALVGFALGWVYAGWSLRAVEDALRLYDHILLRGAHDLKTPLAILRLELRQHAREKGRVGAALRRLEQLADDILFLAEGRTPEPTREPVALASRIREILDLFQEEIRLKKLKTVVEVTDDVVMEVDPHALDRMLLNLVDNAVRYTPEGAWIRVRISPHRLVVENPVSSNGDQAARSRGLGWAVIQEVARAYRWRIDRTVQNGVHRVEVVLKTPSTPPAPPTPSA